MKIIDIVYAFSGELYAKLTAVSMLSVLQNSHNCFVNFTLLVDSFFESEEKKIFEIYKKEYDNFNITYYHMDERFDNAELHIKHINVATYYRLLLPQILNSDKCIYLDSDVLVRTDLTDLFEIDMYDYYVAGVLALGYYTNPKKETYCAEVRIRDVNQYINAGVLVMNLKKLREDNMVDKFMGLISEKFPSQDQDIINKVCYGKIKLLPFYYNVMTKYADWSIEDYQEAFSFEEVEEGWNFPRIIHYADYIKPWNDATSVFSEFWWNICRQTFHFSFFLTHLGERRLYEGLYNSEYRMNNVIKKHLPNLYQLKKHKIAIYGAGENAQLFIDLLHESHIFPEFVVVTNQENNIKYLQGIKVIELNQLPRNNSNITLIVATTKKYQEEIILGLNDYIFEEVLTLDNWLVYWNI